MMWVVMSTRGARRLAKALPRFEPPAQHAADGRDRLSDRIFSARERKSSQVCSVTRVRRKRRSCRTLIVVDEIRTVLRGVADVGRVGGRPSLRFTPLDGGDLVVVRDRAGAHRTVAQWSEGSPSSSGLRAR
jgi:hypothetical protein